MHGDNPNGPLAIAFSLFPLTSVTTLAVRSMFMQVPTAQFLVAALIALVSAGLTGWLAARRPPIAIPSHLRYTAHTAAGANSTLW